MPANPIYPRDREMAGWRWSTELFNKKIDTTPGAAACWGWTGSMGPQGPLFGARKVQPDGTDIAQMTQARRILYAEYTSTALKSGQSVYHSCNNANCMNPTHLTLIRPAPRIIPKPPAEPKPKRASKKPGRPLGSKTRRVRPGDAN